MSSIQDVLINEIGFKKNKINVSKKLGNCGQLEYSGRLQLKKFYDYIYNDSNFYFFRKKLKFESCFEIKK